MAGEKEEPSCDPRVVVGGIALSSACLLLIAAAIVYPSLIPNRDYAIALAATFMGIIIAETYTEAIPRIRDRKEAYGQNRALEDQIKRLEKQNDDLLRHSVLNKVRCGFQLGHTVYAQLIDPDDEGAVIIRICARNLGIEEVLDWIKEPPSLVRENLQGHAIAIRRETVQEQGLRLNHRIGTELFQRTQDDRVSQAFHTGYLTAYFLSEIKSEEPQGLDSESEHDKSSYMRREAGPLEKALLDTLHNMSADEDTALVANLKRQFRSIREGKSTTRCAYWFLDAVFVYMINIFSTEELFVKVRGFLTRKRMSQKGYVEKAKQLLQEMRDADSKGWDDTVRRMS